MIPVDFGRRSDNSAARPSRVRVNVVAVAILAGVDRLGVARVGATGNLDPARRVGSRRLSC